MVDGKKPIICDYFRKAKTGGVCCVQVNNADGSFSFQSTKSVRGIVLFHSLRHTPVAYWRVKEFLDKQSSSMMQGPDGMRYFYKGNLTIYILKNGDVVISENQVYLPGFFDTVDTALKAVSYNNQFLFALSKRINAGQKKPISSADIDEYHNEFKKN
jgi:hypothetical protein